MSAQQIIMAVLADEGGKPGSSLHSWRCEYPDRYGECDCLDQTAEVILTALNEAGYVLVYDARLVATQPDAEQQQHDTHQREHADE